MNELNKYIVKTFSTTLNYFIFGGACLGLVYLVGTLPFEDELKEKVVISVLSAGGPIITTLLQRKNDGKDNTSDDI